jgi:two-component system sensor histidine kinase BarA
MNQESHDAEVYDLALATKIAGGNPKIAAELLALLLKELPAQWEALNQAFTSDNLKKLHEVNHKLHGSARCCGTPALINATRDLEIALAEASRPMIGASVRQVSTAVNQLLELGSVLAPPAE